MINPGVPVGPMGKPIRTEDWYFITKETLVTCTVTVYEGEIVGVSEKVYKQLKTGVALDNDEPDGEIYLVMYRKMVPLLEKNGFVRL